jgi:hypothetical protein
VPGFDVGRKVSSRRFLGGADAFDSVFCHPRARRSQRVFITRRDSGNVLEHVKEIVASGPFEPVVARERGTAGGSLLYDLVEQMRGCGAAIIHVAAGTAPDGPRQPRISGDVLIEIGAAMALYGREFVLLVEDAIELPPNLRGLCECRYSGDALNMPAMMRLLRAFGSFTRRPSGRPLAASERRSAFGYPWQVEEAVTKH